MERGNTFVSVKEKRLNAKKFGAVVFILDPQNRVYTQKEIEKNDSTGKTPGNFSVVCETRLPEESWRNNMIRGIEEETGVRAGDFPKVFSEVEVCWETEFVDKVWANIVILKCKDPDLFMEIVKETCCTDGVEPVGFLARDEFEKLELRAGVRNVVNKFGDSIFTNGKINFN